MSTSTIRIGVVGAGANTRLHHIPKLHAQPDVEIVAVVNRSRASSEKVAAEFGIPNVYNHWREVIDDPAIDAVVIGTWPYLHAPISIAALEANKHVMTEARMACNAAEAHAMWNASRARPHLVAQVVPAPFTLGVDRTVQRLITEGYVGKLLFVEHSDAAAGFIDPTAPLHWRRNRDLSGLNIAMLGIVYEVILRWVGEAVAVSAHTKTFVNQAKDESGRMVAVSVPDHVDVIADLACGAQLHVQQSAATTFKEGAGTWLYGTEGVLRFHNGELTGARKGESEMQSVSVPETERGGWRVEEEFINAIRGLEPITHTTFSDGVKYMEFVEAVSRSAAQGRRIPLPL